MPTPTGTPSADPPASDPPLLRGFHEIWTAAALTVIHQLSGDSRWQLVAESAEPPAVFPVDIAAHWELSGALNGKLAIKLHRAAAHDWSRLLPPAAPPDPEAEPRSFAAPLDDREIAALTEVLGRLAAAASANLSAGGWGEVQIKLRHVGPLRRTVEGVDGEFPLRFVHPESGPLELDLCLEFALRDQVRRGPQPGATAPPAPSSGGRDSDPTAAKLDLLLDVELEVVLRFGGRQMLLHDVLELAPGSVLELDRHIDDPVELLVGGKIIAWGEVVVVDGNYGLRITRLVHRRERIAALGAAR